MKVHEYRAWFKVPTGTEITLVACEEEREMTTYGLSVASDAQFDVYEARGLLRRATDAEARDRSVYVLYDSAPDNRFGHPALIGVYLSPWHAMIEFAGGRYAGPHHWHETNPGEKWVGPDGYGSIVKMPLNDGIRREG